MTRRDRHSLTADYIVVGAGSAGAALAARLSEDPSVSVLLLEAGGPDKALELHVPAAFSKLFRGPYDWNYDTVPQERLERRTVYWPRGKTLGGSSSLNAMMWVRGFAADYDEWAEQAGPAWSWDSLVRYFRRVERTQDPVDETQGSTGAQSIEHQRDPRPHTAAFLDAAREAGHPVTPANLPEGQGFSQTMVSQRRGTRASTADAYLRPARRRRNLRVVTNALVRRVTFARRNDADHAHVGDTGVEAPAPTGALVATGVYVDIEGITRHVRARREVALAGGAINTPQLLMLSGIGPAEHLAEHGIPVLVDAPGVGSNLQDHLVAGLAPEARGGTLFGAERLAELGRYVSSRRGMLTSNVAEAHGFVRTEVADRTGVPDALPDIEIIFAPVPYVGEGLVPTPGEGLTVGAILLRPRSRGTIRLASADPTAKPLIDPAYLTDPDGIDEATMLAGLSECERLIGTDALRAVTTGGWIQPEGGESMTSAERAELSLRRYSHTLYHPVGTARMGMDAASVLDPELRVRGVEGLRVADASVMPTVIRGHTNAPAIVIGEVAADLLRGC
ncbi:GMC family oxidoreductase N-terminal domain-containing protein [Microbacterium sp. CFH 31415]|uniref:GMC family oxidoreductase n=1 Tax=Microbacterium sp. CFH 31415 TaxID=2921732 RepID=UPI001F13AF6F|nr:GMC family oxidoreductase N-terminal domain-containing protein [Microbacterium sp. CFH 31415]MCH6230727.1 GMC family oxidoreductase N-terminal domain-containing protein [Microbacterium sp. CFH 31415]